MGAGAAARHNNSAQQPPTVEGYRLLSASQTCSTQRRFLPKPGTLSQFQEILSEALKAPRALTAQVWHRVSLRERDRDKWVKRETERERNGGTKTHRDWATENVQDKRTEGEEVMGRERERGLNKWSSCLLVPKRASESETLQNHLFSPVGEC